MRAVVPGPGRPSFPNVQSMCMAAIEVYADVWCPFAHVGLNYVSERRREREREDVLLVIRSWPLELINGAALDPETTAFHVQELRSQVAPHLFGGFDPSRFPVTSLPALACAHAAYRQDPRKGEAMSFALRDALFEQGLDISRHDVLAEIADSIDVELYSRADEQAIPRERDEGVQRGVLGSPHFFCGEVDAFCPSLDISRRDGGELVIRRDTAALDVLLASCFGD